MNPNTERQKQNLERLPRVYCESTMAGAKSDSFLILLTSGQTDTVYAFTPEHAKQFAQSLMHQVAEFEKNVRPIPVEWTPNVKSPIQPSQG